MKTTKIYNTMPGIRARRRALGLKAAGLADTLGVTRSAWSQWENGLNMPSSAYLPALAELLQCSIEDLYKDEETDCHTSAAALARNDGKEADADADGAD